MSQKAQKPRGCVCQPEETCCMLDGPKAVKGEGIGNSYKTGKKAAAHMGHGMARYGHSKGTSQVSLGPQPVPATPHKNLAELICGASPDISADLLSSAAEAQSTNPAAQDVVDVTPAAPTAPLRMALKNCFSAGCFHRSSEEPSKFSDSMYAESFEFEHHLKDAEHSKDSTTASLSEPRQEISVKAKSIVDDGLNGYHSKTANLSLYDGFWMSFPSLQPRCKIKNGKLRWRIQGFTQKSVKLEVNEKNELVMAVEGHTHTATLAHGGYDDGMIVWDDGDKWKPDVTANLMCKYDGVWLNMDKRPISQIKDGMLRWLTRWNIDQTLILTVDDEGRLCMTHQGEDSVGELDDSGLLVWSGADRRRKNSFQNKWTKASPKEEADLAISKWWDSDSDEGDLGMTPPPQRAPSEHDLPDPQDHDIFMRVINLPLTSDERIVGSLVQQMNKALKQHIGMPQSQPDIIKWHMVKTKSNQWSGDVVLRIDSAAHAQSAFNLFQDQDVPSSTSALVMRIKLNMHSG